MTETKTLDYFDEYGPNRADECHYGACHEPATEALAAVPYCDRHYLARVALRDRLSGRVQTPQEAWNTLASQLRAEATR